MSLKIWYLALTLFLIVTVSGVVRGVNWGIDAQGNIVDYNNLNPTTPSYKAAKEAFLTDELKLQITNYFKSPGNLKYIKDAIAGDPYNRMVAQMKLSLDLGIQVGSIFAYCFIADEVFGPTTTQELLQDAKDNNVIIQGNFIKPDPITEALKKQGFGIPLLPSPTSDMSSDESNEGSNAPERTSSSNTQGTNNIIGKWDISTPPFSPIIFYSDGTFETGSWYGDGTSNPPKLATGTWIQSGDEIKMTRAGCSDCPIVLQVGPNNLIFSVPGYSDVMWYKGGEGAVSSTVAGVGPLF